MIYLDNAATSFPKAPGVAETVSEYLAEPCGNAGRSSHSLARKASELVFDTRSELAKLLGVKDSKNLVFTLNATSSLNLAILSSVPKGGMIATTSLEHNSVMRPLRYLEANFGVQVLVLDCDADGNINTKRFEKIMSLKPDLFVMTMASNVTGAILPFEEIIKECKENDIKIGLDGSQYIGHAPFNFDKSGADFLAFPGHKGLLAPTGVGGLCLKEDFQPIPLVFGGTGSLSDKEEQPEFSPDKYEAGTPNISGLAGLLTAVRFIKEKGLDKIEQEEKELVNYFVENLQEMPEVTIYTNDFEKRKMPVISINVANMSSSELAQELDAKEVATRQGMHCAPIAHRSIGSFDKGGTVRFSLSPFTTKGEIYETISILKEII